MILNILVFAKIPADIRNQWPGSLLFTMLVLGTLNTLYMSVPFLLNLIWWVLASALFYGLGAWTLLNNRVLVLEIG